MIKYRNSITEDGSILGLSTYDLIIISKMMSTLVGFEFRKQEEFRWSWSWWIFGFWCRQYIVTVYCVSFCEREECEQERSSWAFLLYCFFQLPKFWYKELQINTFPFSVVVHHDNIFRNLSTPKKGITLLTNTANLNFIQVRDSGCCHCLNL